MNKLSKGDLLYIKRRLLTQGLLLILFLAIIATFLIIGIVRNGDRKNIWTVGAILMCLPFAKFLVNYILLIGRDYIKAVDEKYIAFEKNILWNMVISYGEKIIFAKMIFWDATHLVIFCEDKKLDEDKVLKSIKSFLNNGGVNPAISLVRDEKKFVEVIKGLAVSDEPAGKKKRIRELLEVLHV